MKSSLVFDCRLRSIMTWMPTRQSMKRERVQVIEKRVRHFVIPMGMGMGSA